MAARSMLLLGFIAGSVFGATTLWLFQDSERPSGRVTLEGVSGVKAPTNLPSMRVAANDANSREKELKARSDELERALSELARERERVARLSKELDESRTAPRSPLAASRRRVRDSTSVFDAATLEASDYSPEEVVWFRERWEQAEMEKQYLADLVDRDEDPPLGGGYSDIERELREDLRDSGYDAMLFATHQNNRVVLLRVRKDSIASRAGIRNGSIVWSYDGQRVFRAEDLANLSTTGRRGETVEIVIITPDGTEQLFVERNPLGAELVSARARPRSK